MWTWFDNDDQVDQGGGADEIQPNDLLDTVIVSTIPTSFLMAATVIALFWPIDVVWRCRLANFSAGILLSAIFTELYPLLEHVLGLDGHGHYFVMLSMFVGFLCAFVLLHLIDYLPSHRVEREAKADADYHDGYGSFARREPAAGTPRMGPGDPNWNRVAVTKENTKAVTSELKSVLEAVEIFEGAVRLPEANRNATEGYRRQLEHSLFALRARLEGVPESISLSKQRAILEDLAAIKIAGKEIQRQLQRDKPHKRNAVIREHFACISAAASNIHWEMEHHEASCAAALKYVMAYNTLDFDGVRPPGCPSIAGSQISNIPDDTSSAKQLAGLPSVPSARHLKHLSGLSGQTDQDQLITVALEKARYESFAGKKTPRARSGSQVYTFKRDTRQIINTMAQVFFCGFLIGLSYTISERAGYIVSCGATLEMFLMGTNYANAHNFATGTAACRSCGAFIGLFVVPPMTLTLSTIIGSGISASMTADEYIFHGFMTFGIASVSLHLGKSLFSAHLEGLKRMTLDAQPGMTFLGSFLPFAGVYVTWTISALAPNDAQSAG